MIRRICISRFAERLSRPVAPPTKALSSLRIDQSKMVFFNYSTMQMAAKVVYYGPGLCGKTTNLQHIYSHTSNSSRGEMVSLETETDRTLFFDLLPLEVGNIQGFKTRIQLYTVPGQVFYNTTRKLVLKGVDGIVFVADSQRPMLQANVESLQNLRTNLAEIGLTLEEVPLVFQYNKRDLGDICSVEELEEALNPEGRPSFEASALTGDGVFDTLKGISKLTLLRLKERLQQNETSSKPTAAAAPAPPPDLATMHPPDHVEVVDDDPAEQTEQSPTADGETPTEVQASTEPRIATPELDDDASVEASHSATSPSAAEASSEATEPAPQTTSPAEEAAGARERTSRGGGVDILAELEKIRQRARSSSAGRSSEVAARPDPQSANGYAGREIEKKFSFLLDQESLQSARRVRLSLSVENADEEIVDSFEEEIQIESLEDLNELMLRLEIALAAGQTESPGRLD